MDDYKKYVPCFDLPSTSTFGADVLMTDVVDIEVERSNSLHWFVTCPLGGVLEFRVHVECYRREHHTHAT